MGYLPLPKSVTPEYISNNADVFSFKISDDDVNKIAGLTNCCGVPRNPDEVPW